MRRLSVVIPNYNYEQFVAEAIESGLALDWPDVEVVVIDDGSTDGSLDVIRRYEDRVRVLATENATQRVAVNRGVAASTGDVVVILDSDDVLPPDLPQHLSRCWGPETTKAQFLMQRIDPDGRPVGAPFPHYREVPSAEQVRRWQVRTSAYPTAPGSGNAYARWFLDLLVPLDASTGDFSDSALLAAAPLLGDVVTVPEVVVGYRQHAGNDSDLLRDPRRFGREVARARDRWAFASNVAPSLSLDDRALRRSRELLQLRIAAAVALPERDPELPGDSRRAMAWDALMGPLRPGPESARHRLMVSAWCLAALVAPRPIAHRLLRLRYGRRSS